MLRRNRKSIITRNRPSVRIGYRNDYDLCGLPKRFFNPGELETLLSLFDSVQARVVVEIGCHEGRNAVAALRNIASIERYIGIDIEPGTELRLAAQKLEVSSEPGKLAANNPRFELLVRPRGSFDVRANELPIADVVFIDGDHTKDAVLNDYALACAIVRPRGLIICHDDNCLPTVEVTQALNFLCEQGSQFVHIEETWLAYEMRGA